MLTLQSTIQIPQDVLFRDLAGESVLLNLSSGKYYGLDEVGTRMWQLLAEHQHIESVLEILKDEYDVDPDRLQKDLLQLIEHLVANGLMNVSPA